MTILVDTKTNMVMDVANNEEEVTIRPKDIYVAGKKYEGMEYDYN